MEYGKDALAFYLKKYLELLDQAMDYTT